ncbi:MULTISPECIES: hypothetical protein [Lysinibacillus]|uniref:Uncharacterized protein n=1 Tax=Lysinibacillus fusiformis TaxID=28031 RepID=A0A1H9AXB2_9BACI|nr:hypothetical protein [Lysinibacillus fusiformis]MCG7436120.1 hypothetical protein [Lysinibacillus fusiformis]SCX81960.1 hypothetical protein SAMN02787081_00131 [Lysinibacillus fusiformis]SEM76576.1 hypothetical protein SAMN02787103_00131 [Lysinibacillus fusiformis]SEP81053.1 hypothetical protein SAMN02787113_00627 [Lysinibacillus fusiformis]
MRTHLFIVMSLLAIVVLGCTNEELAVEKLAKISISNSVIFGSVHTDFIKGYEDEDSLNLFHKGMTTAVINEGTVNMAAPQFDVQVVDTVGNQYSFHLWYMDERKGYPYNL